MIAGLIVEVKNLFLELRAPKLKPIKPDKGIQGVRILNWKVAIDFASLLNNQVGTIQLTSEAVLKESKHIAYQALLADPVVDNAIKAEQLLNTMIDFQKEYLGYLK